MEKPTASIISTESSNSDDGDTSNLLLKLVDDNNNNNEKSLGGKTYTIDVARLDDEEENGLNNNILIKIMKGTGMLLISPLILTYLTTTFTFMSIGPDWIKRKLVSYWVPFICGKLDVKFQPEREILLQDVRGRVLDIGAGGGAYMQYCTNATNIIALEPVQEMHQTIVETAKKYNITNAQLTVLSLTPEEYLENIKSKNTDNSIDDIYLFDWIILGNVLCEVPNVDTTLYVVDKLIKPDIGRIYFSEHIASPISTWSNLLQNTINPIWRTISYGCNCNRHTIHHMNKYNWEIISWKYNKKIKIAFGEFVIGLARKKGV